MTREERRPSAGRSSTAASVLVIDNYDSFTYNLVQYLGELGAEPEVVRNDEATVDELVARGPGSVIVSPGPCTPAEAGVSADAIRAFAERGTRVLGVCLGHQALAVAFGGRVVRGEPVHGKTAEVEHDGRTIFRGLESPVVAGRYHSLVVDPDLPGELEVSARSGRTVMGLRHRELPAEGVQFHPRVGPHGRRQGAPAELPLPGCLTRFSRRPSTGSRRARTLTADEASEVLRDVMSGNASEAETAGFLIALRTKGETVAEIAGLARTMRDLAAKVEAPGELVDTAGTGGGRPTFNVSTTAAFVAAGAGCKVAKHGNRSATSQCGSADVLEALGASIELEPGAVAECIEAVGFGFMFAPRHHQAMRHVVPVRKELGVRTIFNFLGPLTNPAGARRQVIGVSDGRFLETIAAALGELGTEMGLGSVERGWPRRVHRLGGDQRRGAEGRGSSGASR